jgi:hypothetical protein
LSPGWGDRQDRRDRQDYPTKHAHRNLVHPGAIEPQAADPCKVYLITLHVEQNDTLIWLPSECLMGCPFIASMPMQLSLDPDVADLAPTDPALTRYGEEHLVTYLRMLDANEQGAGWREVSRIDLHLDPAREPDRARRAFDTHLACANWMSGVGYRRLLR